MIHIQVLRTRNLKFPGNKLKKTEILCFSKLTEFKYYHGCSSNKSNKKTENPIWNYEFDLDLIDAHSLIFEIHVNSMFARNRFLGQVKIDLFQFLTQGEGKQLINNPNQRFEFQFPISTQDATLDLSFIYSELIYHPIPVEDIKNPIILAWLTLDPIIEYDGINNPIKLELMEVNVGCNNLYLCYYKNIYYSLYNEFVSWKNTRIESSDKNAFVGSEFAQIHKFHLNSLQGVYAVFILNVSNYTGKVKFNLIAKNWKYPQVNEERMIGTITTIDVQVEANKKYVIPCTFHLEKENEKQFLEIDSIPTNNVVFDKTCQTDNDYLDYIFSENQFHSEIISMIKEANPLLSNINIINNNILPQKGQFSIQKLFRNVGLQANSTIRIYYDGFDKMDSFFSVLDMTNKKISKKNVKGIKEKKEWGRSYNLCFGFSAFYDIDLNIIGKDKAIFINDTNKLNQIYHVDVAMTFIDGENETLLFKNKIEIENKYARYSVLLKIVNIDDDWMLIPVNHGFDYKHEMNSAFERLINDQYLINPITI